MEKRESLCSFFIMQYTENKMFEDYAVEIIEQIQAEIHRKSPADYENGLAGIGVGIEYLAQNGFLDINTDEILEDFNDRINRDIVYEPQENNSLANGLTGLGQYVLYRIIRPSPSSNEIELLVNRELMIHVVNIMENSEFEEDKDWTDVLSFLSRLHRLNLCNPKIERVVEKIKPHFHEESILSESSPEKILSFIPTIQLYNDMENAVVQSVEKMIQTLSDSGTPVVEKENRNTSETLIWLLRCKRLIGQAGIGSRLISELDTLIEKQAEQLHEIRLEKGKLSLKGCAGTGMALMTVSGQCKDEWLDLFG
jgi:hypothetical protein